MKTAEAADLLKIGDLARRTGKTVRALHLYEELGLLHPASRTSGGFRLFDDEALRRIHWIGLLQELGLSLHQIQELLNDWRNHETGPQAMERLRAVFSTKLEEARVQARKYDSLATELGAALRYFETCRTCRPEPKVEACATCPHDHGMEVEPMLVAGLHGSGEKALAPARALIQIDPGPQEANGS